VPHRKVSKMPDYSELELNYARPLADGLINSGFFRKWFLAGTRYAYDYSLAGPIGKSQSRLRSPKMKNPTGSITGAGKTPIVVRVELGPRLKRTFCSSWNATTAADLLSTSKSRGREKG
jgi:hypothetical protein